jgi:WD40 repeat protein
MPPFDLVLTDPTSTAVEKAMFDAVESANLRCSKGLMKNDRGVYRKFLAGEFTGVPDGVALWLADKGRVDEFPPTPRATLLAVAWHTRLGKRRVRISGRRVEPFKEGPANRFGPPWQRWPPLCHLDPEHVVLRTFAGGQPETIALCDCGAVGAPDEIGWVAGRCGPCHDHFEEHGTPLPGDGPVALRTEGRLQAVGFPPSGRTLAATEFLAEPRGGGTTNLALWDRLTGTCRSAPIRANTPEATVFPSGAPGLLLSNGFRALWVNEEGGSLALRGPTSCVALAFEGTTATAVTYAGEGWRRDLTATGDWQRLWPERRRGRDIIYFSVALPPDGETVAVGRTECAIELFEPSGGEGRTLQPPESDEELRHQRVFSLAFSPDGKLLAAGAGRSGFVEDIREEWWGRNGGIYLYDGVKGDYLASFRKPDDDILAVAFSPDGALLFAASTDCTIRVVDVRKMEEVAILGGHIGDVNALAFSPDGKTLASAGGDGLVRLWPWRALLE